MEIANKKHSLEEKKQKISDKKILIVGNNEQKDHLGKNNIVDILQKLLPTLGITPENICVTSDACKVENNSDAIIIFPPEIAKKLPPSSKDLPIVAIRIEDNARPNQIDLLMKNNSNINAIVNGTKYLASAFTLHFADFILDEKLSESQFVMGAKIKPVANKTVQAK